MTRQPSDSRPAGLDRRTFLTAAGAGVAAGIGGSLIQPARAAAPSGSAESQVKVLYDSLTDKQRKQICFAWDHQDKRRGLLRTHLSNNWKITKPAIKSDFYTSEQQRTIRRIWENLVNPDWIQRFDKQFQDDMGGFGRRQSLAIFGSPGQGKFEFVLTGRHGTIRCDGDSADHVAFGGPILYGHAAKGYWEDANHAGNVFWHQAEAANALYKMLDGKQQRAALELDAPDEAKVAFHGKKGSFDGIPVTELSRDQKTHLQDVLKKLLDPYRQSDRDEAVAALKKQGGLDACHLAFYRRDDLGNDGVWDNWRLEGPAFVWHYRGAPHVHVWIHVADSPNVKTNTKNESGPLRR